jgi:transglutaminase-like putative cysteine protease
MPVYRVTHATRYRHASPASAAWQSLHLQPRREPTQQPLSFDLEISPHAGDIAARSDYFGNTIHVFTLREPHAELVITSRSLVQRDETVLPMPGLTPPLSAAREQVTEAIVAGPDFGLEQYLHPSPLVPLPPAARALADELAAEDLPALDWLAALGQRFGEMFTFDAKATTLSTPLTEVLQHRRGVCQDFAHLHISCVRQHGLPAAYVSGYLLTSPPPGQPRLRGADAMHAWASIQVPEVGWVDYDPTNSCFAAAGHIVVARGRDYADVSPTRGVFTGSYSPILRVEVTVEPVGARD